VCAGQFFFFLVDVLRQEKRRTAAVSFFDALDENEPV